MQATYLTARLARKDLSLTEIEKKQKHLYGLLTDRVAVEKMYARFYR